MKKLFIFLSLALLSACGTYYQFNDYMKVWKGISYDRFKVKLESNGISSFGVKISGLQYWVYPFSMKTEKEEKSSSGSSMQYNGLSRSYESVMTNQTVTINKANNYYFIFKEDRLLYCGFLYEMRRHNDKEILEIGEEIYNYNLNN